jgi:hypothetical protein
MSIRKDLLSKSRLPEELLEQFQCRQIGIKWANIKVYLVILHKQLKQEKKEYGNSNLDNKIENYIH